MIKSTRSKNILGKLGQNQENPLECLHVMERDQSKLNLNFKLSYSPLNIIFRSNLDQTSVEILEKSLFYETDLDSVVSSPIDLNEDSSETPQPRSTTSYDITSTETDNSNKSGSRTLSDPQKQDEEIREPSENTEANTENSEESINDDSSDSLEDLGNSEYVNSKIIQVVQQIT